MRRGLREVGLMADRSEEFVDDRDESEGDGGHHQQNTHGVGRFLRWVARQDRDVELDELGDVYQEWLRRRESGDQDDLDCGWSE